MSDTHSSGFKGLMHWTSSHQHDVLTASLLRPRFGNDPDCHRGPKNASCLARCANAKPRRCLCECSKWSPPHDRLWHSAHTAVLATAHSFGRRWNAVRRHSGVTGFLERQRRCVNPMRSPWMPCRLNTPWTSYERYINSSGPQDCCQADYLKMAAIYQVLTSI